MMVPTFRPSAVMTPARLPSLSVRASTSACAGPGATIIATLATMSLSQNYQPIEDEGRGEHHQRLIVLGFLLPPDAEFAHIVEPGNRPLDFPAARRLDWFSNPRPVILTTTFDMGNVAESSDQVIDLVIVIGLVQAQVLAFPATWLGTWHNQALAQQVG